MEEQKNEKEKEENIRRKKIFGQGGAENRRRRKFGEGGSRRMWKEKEENILGKKTVADERTDETRTSDLMKLIMIKMKMMPTKREETEAATT